MVRRVREKERTVHFVCAYVCEEGGGVKQRKREKEKRERKKRNL